VAQKIGTIILYALTLPNIYRFSKLFHWQNQEKICNNDCHILLSHPAVFTSNVHCVRLAAGRRTQAGDATDQWRRRLECVVQQQGGHIEHLMLKTAGCDSNFRQ